MGGPLELLGYVRPIPTRVRRFMRDRPTGPSVRDRRVALIGAGGHASALFRVLAEAGRGVMGYVAPEPSTILNSLEWLGSDDSFWHKMAGFQCDLILAVGDVNQRRRLIEFFSRHGSVRFASVIDPTANVAPDVVRPSDAQVLAGAVIQAGVHLSTHALVNTAAVVEHGCQIGSNAHVASGAVLLGDVSVGDDTLIGGGSVVLPGLSIGKASVVGAGAVVTRDVGDGQIVAGNPARVIRGCA